MDKITVKCTPHPDPELEGKCRVRKPWAPNRFFTEQPEQVERTPEVVRMIALGDLVETKDKPVKDDPGRLPTVPETSPADDFQQAMHGKKKEG